jgi:hypothetical protein
VQNTAAGFVMSHAWYPVSASLHLRSWYRYPDSLGIQRIRIYAADRLAIIGKPYVLEMQLLSE